MKIIVIGSKGFIGSHCMNFFDNPENVVYGCDIINDYNAKNYFLIESTNSDYRSIFEKNQFDICINCSGAANVSNSIENPLRDFALNSFNVFKILDAIRIYQPKIKFINLSSAAVYGNPQYLPIDEKHNINPISPYGFHKLQSENILFEFSELYQLNTCSMRVFSAYGEGLKKQLFWDLFKKLKNSNNIELFGTGDESRDFIYIKDLLNVIKLVIEKANFEGEKINVANGIELKIREAVKTFFNIFNSKRDYIFTGVNKIGNPISWKADISIIKSFGYIQQYSIKQGLGNYIKWLEELK